MLTALAAGALAVAGGSARTPEASHDPACTPCAWHDRHVAVAGRAMTMILATGRVDLAPIRRAGEGERG